MVKTVKNSVSWKQICHHDFIFHFNLVKCDRPIDLFFVLDGSTSVEVCNFKKVQHFLAKELAEMDITPNGIRVGLLQFGKYGQLRLEFGLDEVNSREEAVAAVQGFSYFNGRGTALGSALRATRLVRDNCMFYNTCLMTFLIFSLIFLEAKFHCPYQKVYLFS